MGFVIEGDKLSVSPWVDPSSYVVFLGALFCSYQSSQGNKLLAPYLEFQHPGIYYIWLMQSAHLLADFKS